MIDRCPRCARPGCTRDTFAEPWDTASRAIADECAVREAMREQWCARALAAESMLSACCPAVPAEMLEDDSDPPPALVDLLRASTARALALRARLADPPSLAPLRARAEALLAVAERASPQPWIQSGERRCIDTGRIDGRGDVCDGYSLAPVPNEYDPAEEWEADAPAIVAFRNDAPALIRDLLAALATPKSETARSPEPFLDAARCGTSSVAAGKVPPSADIGNLVDEFGAAAERLGCDPCNADRARAKAVARKAILAALTGKDGAR